MKPSQGHNSNGQASSNARPGQYVIRVDRDSSSNKNIPKGENAKSRDRGSYVVDIDNIYDDKLYVALFLGCAWVMLLTALIIGGQIPKNDTTGIHFGLSSMCCLLTHIFTHFPLCTDSEVLRRLFKSVQVCMLIVLFISSSCLTLSSNQDSVLHAMPPNA